MLDDEIPEPRLSSELVDSLGDLVSGGVSESREEGEELLSRSSVDGLPEDNGVEVPSVDLMETRKCKKGKVSVGRKAWKWKDCKGKKRERRKKQEVEERNERDPCGSSIA